MSASGKPAYLPVYSLIVLLQTFKHHFFIVSLWSVSVSLCKVENFDVVDAADIGRKSRNFSASFIQQKGHTMEAVDFTVSQKKIPPNHQR